PYTTLFRSRIGMQWVAKYFEQWSEDLLACLNEELTARRRQGKIRRQPREKSGTLSLHGGHECQRLHREDRRRVGDRVEHGLTLRLLERLLCLLAPQISRDVTRHAVRSAPQAGIILVGAARERGRSGLRAHTPRPQSKTRISLGDALKFHEQGRIVIAREESKQKAISKAERPCIGRPAQFEQTSVLIDGAPFLPSECF